MSLTISGNTSTTANLTIGTTAVGSIDFNGDTDWWRVYLIGGYCYQIWIEAASSGNGTLIDPYLAIFNSTGVFQHANDDYNLATRDSYVTTIPTGSGNFYLSAEEFGNNAVGSYKITAWLDQLASTSSAATIATDNMMIDRIGWQGDTSDWYGVNLTAGVQYQFDLIGSSGEGSINGLTLSDPYLILRSSDGTSLLENDESGLTHNARIFYTPKVSGKYFLDVQEYGNNGYGTYGIIVNESPASGNLTLGTPKIGTISFNSEFNLYGINLTAGITYGFSLDGVTLADPYLEVLNSSGSTISADDDNGTGLNSYLSFTPTTTGTYFLAARESGNNATGTYSARVWQLPTVSIADAIVTEDNAKNANLVFTLTLSAVSPIDVSFTVTTSGTSTASYSADYTPVSRNVIISAGQTSTSFTVEVLGDTIFEPTESFHVLVSNPENVLLDDSEALGLIIDNDNPYSIPSDQYLRLQWYLYPTTGINIFPVWTDYTGSGIRIAVFDQGIDPNHPDLKDNLLTSLGRNAYDLSIGGAPVIFTDNHGTMVAGTIAAKLNGQGVVGVAYDAKLVSIYNQMTSTEIPNAFTYAQNFDVLNNSWGFAPQGTSYYALHGNWAFADNFLSASFSAAGTALESLATMGRKGLGTVVVQSAGNSFGVGDDTNLHNFQNSQYIITVAATDYAGNVTSYSSPGASVLIAAPGGGGVDVLSDIITTDRVGADGTSVSDYTSTAGTSFSAPIVSGIVALMLEANPNLGYRDIQEILAYSAREVSTASNDWRFNGATNWNGGGLHYDALSHNLGYGLIDALAAVRLAETWTTEPHTAENREQITTTHTVSKSIPDGGGINAVSSAFDAISITKAIDVERAEITLNVTHPFIGDLSILLTSPNGVSSFLLWRPQQNALSAYGTNQDNIHFTFDTVLNWGENSIGTWMLSIYDNAYGDVGKFESWTLNLIGKPASADDTYIYTNEFSQSTTLQSVRSTLTDSEGIDTLNASAVTSNLVLNLRSGGVSKIDDRSLSISEGTIIENAYGGDNNDIINGNSVANILNGMRGNDTIEGGEGNDILIGGEGTDTVILTGLISNYDVTYNTNNKSFTITDKISHRDGTDVVSSIEVFQFADGSRTAVALIDTTAPTITTFSPADDASEVPTGANIVLTFSEPIQAGTGNIVISNGTDTRTISIGDAQITVSGNTITINPTADLQDNSTYSVQLASGVIKDLTGNVYAGIDNTTTLNFSTAAPADTTAPTLASSTPSNNASAIAVDANIVMTFSEPIQKGAGNITLKTVTGETIATFAPNSPNVTISGNQLTINPTANLNAGTAYTFEIESTAIQDLAGNFYVNLNNSVYNFTTVSAPANLLPTGKSATLKGKEDIAIQLAVRDFGFSDANKSDKLQAISITALPEHGMLKLNGNTVMTGASILAADITAGNLTYVPESNLNGAPADTLRFKVSDGKDLSAEASTLSFNLAPVNDAPSFNSDLAIPDQNITEGQAFALSLPQGLFSDLDGDTLTLKATANGKALPKWLKFDAATGSFTGTPLDADSNTTLTLKVTATDKGKLSVEDSFDLVITGVNVAPTAKPITTVSKVTEGKAFSFALPKTTFTDGDKGDVLTITMTDGPQGMVFDSNTKKLSWLPGYSAADTPQQTVTFLATDQQGATASTVLNLEVTNVPTIKGTNNNDSLLASLGDDLLNGAAGDDILNGGSGADSLSGGAGNDHLTGGTGSDRFILDTAPNASTNLDVIADFNPNEDTLTLSKKVFTAFKSLPLTANNLRAGEGITTAADNNDFLIYNTNTGALYYDADGSGIAKMPIQLVTLTGAPTLTVELMSLM